MAWIAVVTNAGRALLDSYAAGGHTLNLTGATVGSGVVADANLRIQTEITDEKDTASIISAKEVDDGVKYKIQVGPASDSVGAYTAHQIGIWANLDDGADTLLMLAQDAVDGMAVPLASVSPAFAFAIFIAMTVDNTDELTVEIDETAYVTIGTLQEAVEDIKATPFVVSIPTGQWSGSGSDYYITINATNVTPDSILIPNYDSQSESRLKGPVWCVPDEGSFTIHTTKIPSNTVEILIQFFGVKGEAQYQVLADVYSKSQTYSKTETDSKIAQSTADKVHFGVIANGTDLNTILTTGLYQSPGAVASISTLINCPVAVPFIMIVRGENGTSGCIQMIASEGVIYTRRGITSGLGSWYKFTGTVVS